MSQTLYRVSAVFSAVLVAGPLTATTPDTTIPDPAGPMAQAPESVFPLERTPEFSQPIWTPSIEASAQFTPEPARDLAQSVQAGDGQANRAPTQAVPEEAEVADSESHNVNGRYLVESVDVVERGSSQRQRLSLPLQDQLSGLIGQNYDRGMLRGLARQIREDLSVPNVDVDVARGVTQDSVRVTFEIGQQERDGFDLDLERFLYHSKQGWTGEGKASIRLKGNAFSFGLVSDGDRLAERFAGIKAGYERYVVGTNRLSLKFDFLSYHQQWNRNTLEAARPEDIYRTRQHFIPEGTLYIAQPLTLSFGVDFARYQIAVPSPVGQEAVARTESSNAAVSTLRYRQRWDSDRRHYQELNASYGIRAGTGVLESDRVFAKHTAEATYIVRNGRSQLNVEFVAGRITGAAPLFERYILGNAELLRGWNKFDLAPLGGSNAIHGSIEYRYRTFLIFYDTGAIWDDPTQREQKNSLGLGLNPGPVEMAVAWPIRSGRATPVFYIGMNF